MQFGYHKSRSIVPLAELASRGRSENQRPLVSLEQFSARPTKTRWLGALSLAALDSATMRTPLACKLRVIISPWKSLPTFLNEPMVAMSLLLFVFRARDRRGLDGDLQAEDDRRRTRRAATQWRTQSQRLSWLARNGRSPGEESRCDGVAF